MNFNELGSNIRHWTIEDEEMLIGKIKGYCDKYKVHCETLEQNIKGVEDNIEIVNVDLLNGLNALKKLALNKYSVFEINNEEQKDIRRTENNYKKNCILDNNNKEEKERNMLLKYNNAIKTSMNSLKIMNNNNGFDFGEEVRKSELKLPCLIGTKAFFASETLGIVNKRVEYCEMASDRRNWEVEERRKGSENIKIGSSIRHIEPIKALDNFIMKKPNNLFDNKDFEKEKAKEIIKQDEKKKIFDNYNDDIEDRLLFFNQFELPSSSSIIKNSIESHLKTDPDNSKKPQISIDHYVKKGFFDDDNNDDGNSQEIQQSITKAKTLIDMGLFIDLKSNKEDQRIIIGPSPILPIKQTKEVNDNHKGNNNQLESAKQKLFQMFDDNEDEEGLNEDNTGNTKMIEDKTNAVAKKLQMITGENPIITDHNENKNLIVITAPIKSIIKEQKDFNKSPTQIKADELKKDAKKTQFSFQDDDNSLSNKFRDNKKTEIKLTNYLKENNDSIKKKSLVQLDFMFEDDDENELNKRKDIIKENQPIFILTTKPQIKDDNTHFSPKPFKENANEKKKDISTKLSQLFSQDDELLENISNSIISQTDMPSFAQMKSLLNQRFNSSIPQSISPEALIISKPSETDNNNHTTQNNTIELLTNHRVIVQKKKPHRPIFKDDSLSKSSPFKDHIIINTKPISTTKPLELLSSQQISNSTNKPKALKFLFNFDDEE